MTDPCTLVSVLGSDTPAVIYPLCPQATSAVIYLAGLLEQRHHISLTLEGAAYPGRECLQIDDIMAFFGWLRDESEGFGVSLT